MTGFLIFDNAGDQSNQMVIEELTREDEGMYQCEYKSRAAHTFHLKVVPVRQKPIVVKAYNEGEPPKLVCKSHGGFPAPVVTWGDADVGTRFRMAGEEVIQDYNIDSTIDVAEFLQLAHVTEARITCYATWPEMLFDNYHQAMNYISYNLSSDGLTPPIFLNHSTLYKYTHEDVHNHISNQADAITEEEALSKHMTPLIWGIVGCAAVAVIVLITCYFIARSKKTKGNRIFKADHDPISVVYHDNI